MIWQMKVIVACATDSIGASGGPAPSRSSIFYLIPPRVQSKFRRDERCGGYVARMK